MTTFLLPLLLVLGAGLLLPDCGPALLVVLFMLAAVLGTIAAALVVVLGTLGLAGALAIKATVRKACAAPVGRLLAGLVMIALLFSLGGCASLVPHEARRRLLGMATPDLLACLGPPAERDESIPRLHVWTWSYTDPGSSIALGSMAALGMGVSLEEHGSCRVIVAMSGGHVTSVHFSPASDGIAGPLGACQPIVRDCMNFPTVTPLPADYHPDAPTLAAAK